MIDLKFEVRPSGMRWLATLHIVKDGRAAAGCRVSGDTPQSAVAKSAKNFHTILTEIGTTLVDDDDVEHLVRQLEGTLCALDAKYAERPELQHDPDLTLRNT